MIPQEKYVYWEKQGKDRMCGLHAINSLMQGPVFDVSTLFQIAHELDSAEREILESAGMVVGAEGTTNIADDGNYNVQVLTKALENYGSYEIERIDKPGVAPESGSFCEDQGFLWHSVDHWFSIRKVHDTWFNLNSTNMSPGPQIISDFYLDAFLGAVKEKGYTVFVIRGEDLPMPNKSENEEAINQDDNDYKDWKQVYIEYSVLKVYYENNKGMQLNTDGADQNEMDEAIKASLNDFQGHDVPVPKFNDDHDENFGYQDQNQDFVNQEDEELKRAIEMSLQGETGGNPPEGAPTSENN